MLLNFFIPVAVNASIPSLMCCISLCALFVLKWPHILCILRSIEKLIVFSVHLSLLCFQLIAMVGKMIKAKESGAMYEELPRDTCGMRRLTQVLRNGGGKFLNRDFVKLTGVRRNAQDDMIDSMCFFIGVTAKVFTHFVVYCGLSLTSSQ